MRLRLIVLLAALAGPAAASPSPAGMWWTEDHGGILRIAPCGPQMCGTIVGQDSPKGRPVDRQGVLQCGLTILRGAPDDDDPGHYTGSITNPDDGKNWRAKFWIGEDGKMQLRGYVLMPMLGETQHWPPFRGKVDPDCTIHP